jgi:nucleoside-diphosphate-sugar epimerase
MVGHLGIVGASGFIGRELARQAVAAGWRVCGYSRSPRSAGGDVAEWREWSATRARESTAAEISTLVLEIQDET